LRYYSYDPQAYYNEKAEEYTVLYIPPEKERCYSNTTISATDKRLSNTTAAIQENHINISESYDKWRDLAIVFNKEFGGFAVCY
jgi:hypothetical protein